MHTISAEPMAAGYTVDRDDHITDTETESVSKVAGMDWNPTHLEKDSESLRQVTHEPAREKCRNAASE